MTETKIEQTKTEARGGNRKGAGRPRKTDLSNSQFIVKTLRDISEKAPESASRLEALRELHRLTLHENQVEKQIKACRNTIESLQDEKKSAIEIFRGIATAFKMGKVIFIDDDSHESRLAKSLLAELPSLIPQNEYPKTA